MSTRVRLLLVGNGGHARVVLATLRLDPGIEVVGVVGPAARGDLDGIPLMGDDADLEVLHRQAAAAFVAVGDNARRDALFARVRELGFELPNAVHPAAVVDTAAAVGQGVAVMAGAIVNAGAQIGDAAILNTGATVDHDCRIGRAAHVAPGANLSGYVVVGNRALIGIGSVVGTGRPLAVGEDAVVGAGSVVVRDVPAGVTVAGNPARQLERVP